MVEKLAARAAAGYSDGWMFTADEGVPVLHHNFMERHYSRAIARLLAAAKEAAEQWKPQPVTVPAELDFHDLRHTSAALLIEQSRHMEEVKDYLGHSSIRVTSDRYGHLFPKAKQAMADGLDAAFRRTTLEMH